MSAHGTEQMCNIPENGICEMQASGTTVAPIQFGLNCCETAAWRCGSSAWRCGCYKLVFYLSKSCSQMKGVPCFPAVSPIPSISTNEASQTARLCCLETKLGFHDTTTIIEKGKYYFPDLVYVRPNKHQLGYKNKGRTLYVIAREEKDGLYKQQLAFQCNVMSPSAGGMASPFSATEGSCSTSNLLSLLLLPSGLVASPAHWHQWSLSLLIPPVN